MPLQKNQILTLRIERLSSDGSGVAHSADGEAVFVPGTAPGDEARVRIVKDCGRYAFGILDELLTPSALLSEAIRRSCFCFSGTRHH